MCHDAKILKWEFHVSDEVLLYNSILKLYTCKLRSKWLGLFVVSKVYPSGAIEQKDTKKKKFMVNGKILKHYHVGGPETAKIELVRLKYPQ